MASEWAQKNQYEYKSNSNLVLQADRSLIEHRSRDEPTGEVLPLTSQISKYRMGDKFQRSKPNINKNKKIIEKDDNEILKLEEISGITYRPKIAETRSVYESILSFIQATIGEQPRDILMGACDEVLAVLKDETIKDKDKHTEISGLLGSMADERYSILVNLCKKVTDYHADQDLVEHEEGVGVTVQYDDDEDESQDDRTEQFEVDEESNNSDEGYDKSIHGKFTDASAIKSELLNPWEIDAFWLQRELNKFYDDAELSHRKAKETIEILKLSSDERDMENKLVLLLGHDKFTLIKTLRANKNIVLYCTLLAAAQSTEDRERIENMMKQNPELNDILDKFKNETVNDRFESRVSDKKVVSNDKGNETELDTIDLDFLAFKEGSRLMTNKKCHLPEGSFRKQRRGYEEVHVPSPKQIPLEDSEQLYPISNLPQFARPVFGRYQFLNRIQSKIVNQALFTDENLLVCAPTGSGKTNVAILCILREMGKCLNPDNTVNLDEFKIIYVAPMKSLVQEIVMNFTKRLSDYGIVVSEMTGDHQLNRDQIDKTQIIVCTPEKWDIVTRKAGEKTFTQLVRLIIIDEIHMLHDERGPVIESLVARTLRYREHFRQHIRIVGLSATLPNYQDVALFIGVNPSTGLFHFDSSYRPVPLEQQYIGITEKKPLKSLKIMNDIVYEKIIERAGSSQILVFVHSRKETIKTAKFIRDMCLEKETLGLFVNPNSASAEILKSESDQSKNSDLKEILQFGFGIHHAGMNKIDRKLVEDLFADGHIQVLFSTATLAWGVNLPAHTVIIRGTQIYNPEKGKWVDLGGLDVLQMLGRAGRPQYDTKGVGILITSHSELQYYLSLMNQQLPIESHFISKIADHLNAEVSLGTISSIEDGAKWLSYTYFFIRLLRNPSLYGSSVEEVEQDRQLFESRLSIIHSAALQLDKSGLVTYDQRSGQLVGTDLGRIASHYYCTMETITTFNRLLRPTMSQIELFRVVSMASEFKYITIRAEEKIELQHLLEKVPVPVKETIEDSASKINVLLQAYISQLKLEGFVLMADMIYITQSAGRLVRTLFEICQSRNWADMSEKTLNFSKMIDKRMWLSMTPLRQFKKIPFEILRKIEKKDISWDRFYDLEPHEIGELIHAPKMGKALHKFIHHFPKLELTSHAQPITRSLLRIELTILPDFIWDEAIHGNSEAFWVFVTDVDSETILHSEYFILNHRFSTDEHYLKFFVPIFDPLPPCYFIKVLSDRWVHAQTVLPVSLKNLTLPEKNPPPTELLDLQLLPMSAVKSEVIQSIFPNVTHLNSIQTQVFNTLTNSNDSIFIGAPAGCGKTLCAELAILSHLSSVQDVGRIIYIVPFDTVCQMMIHRFRHVFEIHMNVKVAVLTGESAADLKLINHSTIIISSPENFDMFSRRWKQRKVIQQIKLFIVDDLHMVGSANGPCIEIVCSRMRYISSQLSQPIRIIALSSSLLNARDVSQWLGIGNNTTYNFHPSNRPVPINLHIQGYSLNNPISRILAMSSTIYPTYKSLVGSQNLIVFVATRKQATLAALELSLLISNEETNVDQADPSISEIKSYFSVIADSEQRESLQNRIAFLHEGMNLIERRLIQTLFDQGHIKSLIVSRDMCWALEVMSSVVVIMDTQNYDGKYKNYIDYPISDIIKMVGRAGNPSKDHYGTVKILCLTSKKEQHLKFLKESLPIESHLDRCLHDHFCAEIVTHAIETKQDAVDYLTWTFLYRRMTQNSNYYNMQGITHRHLSDHLSELVENTLSDLATSKCISIEDEMNLFPLNSGMIASYYYIKYPTIELFNASLNAKTKLKALIEIISSASEFENALSLRINDDYYLKNLVSRVKFKTKDGRIGEAHNKTNLLIQAYLSRLQLTPELQTDTDIIVSKVHKLAQAAVDVISSNGWLQPAIVAMEFAQMITQAMWPKESPLKQIPYFTSDVIQRCNDNNINTVFDLLDMDNEPRKQVLKLSDSQLVDVAKFCNRYPSIEVQHSLSDDGFVMAGESVSVTIQLERDDEMNTPVVAPFFPYSREEAIWVVIGNTDSNLLLAIKRVNLQKSSTLKLEFTAPDEPGEHKYSLYIISDSYIGSDQEFELIIHVNETKASRKRKAQLDECDDQVPTKI